MLNDETRKAIEGKIFKGFTTARDTYEEIKSDGQSLSMEWYVDKMKEIVAQRLTIIEMKQVNQHDIIAYYSESQHQKEIKLEMLYRITNLCIDKIKIKFKQLKEAFKLMDGYLYELNPHALTINDKKYNADLMELLEL